MDYHKKNETFDYHRCICAEAVGSDVVTLGNDPVPESVPWGIANRVLGNGYCRLVSREVGSDQW